MSISISHIIPVILILQSGLFAFVLFTDQGPKKNSNRLLASFLLILATQFVCILLKDAFPPAIFMERIMCVFGFAYGPLLYFYTRSLIFNDFEFKPLHLLHFLPSLVFFLSPLANCPLCFDFGILLYLSLVVYVSLAIQDLLYYRRIVRNTQSEISRMELKWLQWTMILFCGTLFLDVLDHMFWNLDIGGLSPIHISLLILVNWMFYKGLKQPQLFLGVSQTDQNLVQGRTGKWAEEDPQVEVELEKIWRYLTEERPFTDPNLSLSDLAEQLELPIRRLSFLINTHFGQNFMSFINEHRINLAKERLLAPKDPGETILEVMYDVGFNSKSSFNTLFKQTTGMTPTQFRKQKGDH